MERSYEVALAERGKQRVRLPAMGVTSAGGGWRFQKPPAHLGTFLPLSSAVGGRSRGDRGGGGGGCLI